MFDRRLVQNFDWLLLVLVFLITAMGLVNLYSAGFNRAGGGTPLYIKQLYWLAVGLGGAALMYAYDLWLYRVLPLTDTTYDVKRLFSSRMVTGIRSWSTASNSTLSSSCRLRNSMSYFSPSGR